MVIDFQARRDFLEGAVHSILEFTHRRQQFSSAESVVPHSLTVQLGTFPPILSYFPGLQNKLPDALSCKPEYDSLCSSPWPQLKKES